MLNELGSNEQNKLDSNEQNEHGSTLAAYKVITISDTGGKCINILVTMKFIIICNVITV